MLEGSPRRRDVEGNAVMVRTGWPKLGKGPRLVFFKPGGECSRQDLRLLVLWHVFAPNPRGSSIDSNGLTMTLEQGSGKGSAAQGAKTGLVTQHFLAQISVLCDKFRIHSCGLP